MDDDLMDLCDSPTVRSLLDFIDETPLEYRTSTTVSMFEVAPNTTQMQSDEQNAQENTATNSSNATTTDQTTAPMVDYGTLSLRILEALRQKISDFGPELRRMGLGEDEANQIINQIATLPLSKDLGIYERALQPLAYVFYYASPQNMSLEESTDPAPTTQEPLETIGDRVHEPVDQLTASIAAYQQPDPSEKILGLLAEAEIIVNELNLVRLGILDHPKAFWHSRGLKDIVNGKASALTGECDQQNRFIWIEWSDLAAYKPEEVFVLVQLLTFDNEIHQTKCIVPLRTTVKKNSGQVGPYPRRALTLENLIIEEKYGFDRKRKLLLYPIEPEKASPNRMNLRVIVVNLEKCGNVKGGIEDPASIEAQLAKIFKLRLQMVRLIETGTLESISNAIETQLVEESKETRVLQAYSPSFVPGEPSAIEVKFNTNTDKAGFHVFINGEELELGEFEALHKKTMLIKSDEFANDCHLRITKSSAMETIRQGHDPRKGLVQKPLVDANVQHHRFEPNNQLRTNSE